MTDRKSIVNSIRKQYPTHANLFIRFGSCCFLLKSNSEEMIDELRRYFSNFVTDESPVYQTITVHEAPEPGLGLGFIPNQPDPGKPKVKEEYADVAGGRVVRKRLTGMLFIFGGDDHVAVGPCLRNPNQVINFINNRYIAMKLDDGCLLGHAAGVVYKGCGLALAGFSGAGKSTLALNLMSRGAFFTSNDRLMIKPCGTGLGMSGVAKLPRINPGTALNNPDLSHIIGKPERSEYDAMGPDALWKLEQKYDVYIDECFGRGRFIIEHMMHMLVILNWNRCEGSIRVEEIDPHERHDLLGAFMKSEGLFYIQDKGSTASRDVSEGAYARMLERCRMIEISGCVDFDAAAEKCIEMISQGAYA